MCYHHHEPAYEQINNIFTICRAQGPRQEFYSFIYNKLTKVNFENLPSPSHIGENLAQSVGLVFELDVYAFVCLRIVRS